jgi:hypothetical protein
VIGPCTGRSHGLIGRIWSVQRSSQARRCFGLQLARPVPRGTRVSGRAPRGVECGEELIERAARPITRDRTRLVMMGDL